MRLAAALAATVLLLGSSGSAEEGAAGSGQQEPLPSELTEEVEVRLVTLPILVTDKRGRPVTDLRVEEVEVRENGKSREIAFLEPYRTSDTVVPPAGGEEQSGEDSPAAPQVRRVEGRRPEPRRVIFLLDAMASRLPNRLKWAEGALQWVRQEMQPSDSVAVVVFDGRVRYVVPFTSDPGVVESSLKSPYYLEQRHFDRREEVSSLMDALTTCDRSYDQTRCALIAVESYVFQWRQETKITIEALTGFVSALGAIPGRKTVIYGSEGFLRDPGSAAINAILAEFGTDKMSWSDLRIHLRGDYSRELTDLFRTGAAAGTAFFPIDVRSIADRDWVSDASQQFQLHERQLFNPMADIFDASRDTLGTLARATGGRTYFGADAAARITEAIDSSRGLYTVGYYGSPLVGASRKVKVKIKRRKVQASDPGGAAPATPPRPLAIEIGVLGSRPEGLRHTVPVAVEFEMERLPLRRGPDRSWVAQVSVYAALVDGKGNVAGEAFEMVDISIEDADKGEEEARIFRHLIPVRVDPGRYRARVRVTDDRLAVRADRLLPQEFVVPFPESSDR